MAAQREVLEGQKPLLNRCEHGASIVRRFKALPVSFSVLLSGSFDRDAMGFDLVAKERNLGEKGYFRADVYQDDLTANCNGHSRE